MQILVDVVSALKVHHAMVSTSVLTAGEEHASSNTCTGAYETRSGRKELPTRWIHLSQSVTAHPLPPVLLPASLFSIKCQDWPFYNHICDWGSGIQMQSMPIRMKGLLIEKGEMVWGILPLFILTNTVIRFKHQAGIWTFLSAGCWWFTGNPGLYLELAAAIFN